jgi:hypothetical protein
MALPPGSFVMGVTHNSEFIIFSIISNPDDIEIFTPLSVFWVKLS